LTGGAEVVREVRADDALTYDDIHLRDSLLCELRREQDETLTSASSAGGTTEVESPARHACTPPPAAATPL
jgi:hypothetical protein